MPKLYRWAIVAVCFGWLFGIAPVIIFLREWDPPTQYLTKHDAVTLYILLPLEFPAVAVGLLFIFVPLACLIEWALDNDEEETEPELSSPQELYAVGKIDIEELERLVK